jgi:hypothetical protein
VTASDDLQLTIRRGIEKLRSAPPVAADLDEVKAAIGLLFDAVGDEFAAAAGQHPALSPEELRRLAFDNDLAAHGNRYDLVRIAHEITRLRNQQGPVVSAAVVFEHDLAEAQKEAKRRATIAREGNQQQSLFDMDDETLKQGIWQLGEGRGVRMADAELVDVITHEAINATKFAEYATARGRTSRIHAEMVQELAKRPPGTTLWQVTHP